MIPRKVINLLQNREFISVATCDPSGRPNAAPKMVLKAEGNCVYLVDYTIGTTFRNLRVNPRASISFMDLETLFGYQLNGQVTIIEKGAQYDAMLKELLLREIDLSIKRIVEGVRKEKAHKTFELEITENLIIFKIDMEEFVEIGPHGGLKREVI